MDATLTARLIPNDAARSRLWPRPPGALKAALFYDACIGCGDCAEICPSDAIEMDSTDCPVVRPGRLCSHCGLCSDVCSRDAIRLTARTRAHLARIVAAERAAG